MEKQNEKETEINEIKETMEETKKVESHKRAMYRAMCKDNLNGICAKQSGLLYKGIHPIHESPYCGHITIACTADANCQRMKRYDKVNPE